MKTLSIIVAAELLAAPAFGAPRVHHMEFDPGPAGKSEIRSFKQVESLLLTPSPKPVYPLAARRSRVTGSGLVGGHVTPAGDVDQTWMGVSTGSPLLDRAATSWLKRCRFKPGHDFFFKMPITFTLGRRPY